MIDVILFLFVGSSGVGKSRLAKEYANILVGADNLIRVDMSEYSDSTSVNKILGSSPGYIDMMIIKMFWKKLEINLIVFLLLDEIDKAHPNVINLFYQILEEGKIKNSKGREVRFNNVVVIMTSNIGFEKNGIGFNKKTDSSVISSLKGYFNTAFINRIDNIIVFDRLDATSIKCIIRKNLSILEINIKILILILMIMLLMRLLISVNFMSLGLGELIRLFLKILRILLLMGLLEGIRIFILILLLKKKNITS